MKSEIDDKRLINYQNIKNIGPIKPNHDVFIYATYLKPGLH